jgi:GNAT superfamily N-acetyltransferase
MTGRTVLEQECTARGWSQPAVFLAAFAQTAEEFGEDVALTDRQLRRWRQPNPPRPRPRAWRVLYSMFGASPTSLGFPEPPAGLPQYESPARGIERRTLLGGTIGTAVGITFASADVVGTAHLTELREGLRSLFSLDDAYGSSDVRPLAGRHLARIRRVINSGTYPDSIGRQLHLLAGETAEHCGWLAYDADQQDDASRHWGDALTSATMLGDDSLQVLVMASLNLQAIHLGRPRDGLELARSARRRAEAMGSPVLQSVLATRESRALATMLDASGARRALADAMRVAERAGRGRPAPPWADFHGQAELDYAQGMLYTDAGHHQAAVPYLRAALAEPPYNEGPRDIAEFIERFQRQALRPGFRVVAARWGGSPVGFAFGYLLPSDTRWWAGALSPLPAEFTAEDGKRTFVIIELAVRRPWRRQGVAAQMHAGLLDGLKAGRATLTMRPEPEAAPAQAAYAKWGYRTVGQLRPWDEAPVYDAMVVDLN